MTSETLYTISGKVYYLARVALLPNSTLTVRLRDVSRADAPAKELAVQVTPNANSAGLGFSLSYAQSDIISGHTYVISASITHEDRLIFTTTQHHRVELEANYLKEQEARVDFVG